MSVMTRLAMCGAMLLAVAGTMAAGQSTGPQLPSLVLDSMYGPDLFGMYCATCHGRDGKGGGPVVGALKAAPPDLTLLSRRHQGVFPAREVEATIAGGRVVTAHGSDEMPVWGPIFRSLDPSDARAKARIRSLVAHIESIQQKSPR